jgi:hypothetical protein
MYRSKFLSAHTVRLASAVPIAAGLALAAAVIPAGMASAAPAALPANCTQSGATVTCSYGYTGAEQDFTVPAGITSVQVDAIGAAGGANGGGWPGGQGAKVTGTLGGLSGGQVLYVEVGQAPDTATTPFGKAPTAFNGGGAPGFGQGSGGGGGATDVRTISRAASGSLASRLIVAGGGGGNADALGKGLPPANAGENAQPATAGVYVGQGGFAGTQTAGGAGGQRGTGATGCMGNPGGAGSLGQGGHGADGGPSSGGGGGLYGGGGGGAPADCGDDDAVAGGGGGGSSLVPAGGSQTLTSSPASVTLTYTQPQTQQVAYQVKLQYDPAKAYHSGATVPVKIQLLNAAGANVSAAGIPVTVTGLSPSPAPGQAPAGTFTFVRLPGGPGYQLNVKTTGYPAGTYALSFKAGSDPTSDTAQFVIS